MRTSSGRRRRGRAGRAGWVGLVLASVLALVATPTTYGALTSTVRNSTNTASSSVYNTTTCRAVTTGVSGAWFILPLSETTGTVADDVGSGGRDGTYTNTGGITRNVSGPCLRDSANAIRLNGTSGFVAGTTTTQANPTVFSIQVWFRTTTARGGKLIGFGNGTGTTASGQFDRHLYMSNAGKVFFGVYPNAVRTIASTTALNDGRWHQTVATLSGAGMRLYVDGALVASDTATTSAESYTGSWRVGWDAVAGWTDSPTSQYFAGDLAWASVYTTALTAAQVQAMYNAGK